MVEDPPEGLSEASERLWNDVVAAFEFSAAELVVWESACRMRDRADAASALVEREGILLRDRTGGLKQNPACDVEARARTIFASLIGKLGIVVPAKESPRTRSARAAANARWSRH